MRVATEALDDGLMAPLEGQRAFQPRLREEHHRLFVDLCRLAVHVRHVGKRALRRREGLVQAGERFGQALRTALKDPAVVQRMTELGADIVPDAKLTPDGLRTWLKPEIDKWGALIRAAGNYAD